MTVLQRGQLSSSSQSKSSFRLCPVLFDLSLEQCVKFYPPLRSWQSCLEASQPLMKRHTTTHQVHYLCYLSHFISIISLIYDCYCCCGLVVFLVLFLCIL